MPADSLSEMALRACIRNIKRLYDIGDCPYELLRPALLKIESPDQLRQLEINSPQIIGSDSEIWLSFIKRDIPNWQSKRHEPRDPRNWWKVYRKLKQEAQDDMDQGAEKLKAAFANIEDEKEQNLALLRTRRELPKEQPSLRQKMAHAYFTGKTGSKGSHKLTLMEKIKKETRDSRMYRMAVPTKDLKKMATAVRVAPKDFVDEVKKEAERKSHLSPATRAPVQTATSLTRPSSSSNQASERSRQEGEARLRALISGQRLSPRGVVETVAPLDSPPIVPERSRPATSTRPFGRSSTSESTPLSPTRPSGRSSVSKSAPLSPTHRRRMEPSHPIRDRQSRTSPPLIKGASTSTSVRRGSQSPQPLERKRKAEPSIFMGTKRSRVTAPPSSASIDDMF